MRIALLVLRCTSELHCFHCRSQPDHLLPLLQATVAAQRNSFCRILLLPRLRLRHARRKFACAEVVSIFKNVSPRAPVRTTDRQPNKEKDRRQTNSSAWPCTGQHCNTRNNAGTLPNHLDVSWLTHNTASPRRGPWRQSPRCPLPTPVPQRQVRWTHLR